MYKLEITLKQHTPLIHFQHDQEGATLRASEVKPKLDRFIINKLISKGIKYQNLLINESKHALNYKLKVLTNKDSITINDIPSRFSLFFGNMGNDEKKSFSVCHNNIKFICQSYNNDIIMLIKENINEFFSATNFSTRQNKGFGSFYIIPPKNESVFDNIEKRLPKPTWFMEMDTVNDRDIWEAIDYYCRRLKSGISRIGKKEEPYEYQKSFLRINNKNVNWEKKHFKHMFFQENINEKNSVFLRAILGLSPTYIFRPGNLDKDGKNKLIDEYLIIVEHDSVNRIPSPLLFKIIKDEKKTKVYILVNELPTEIYNSINSSVFKFTAYFKYKYWKTVNGEKIIGNRGPLMSSKMIKANSNIANCLSQTQIDDSIDEGQIDRLKKFLEWNGNEPYIELFLPNKQVSIVELIKDYHKELGNSFTAKRMQNNHRYKDIYIQINKTK